MLTNQWRKSTRSGDSGNCAEVRRNGDRIEVRDSKQGTTGPVLSFTLAEWEAFAGGFKLGEFDV